MVVNKPVRYTSKAYFTIVILAILLVPQFASAQIWLNQQISANYQNSTLLEVLQDLSEKSGATFSYNPNKLPLDSTITQQFNKRSLQSILDEISQQLPIRYEMMDKYIILKKAKAPAPVPSQKKEQFTLHGFIKDKNTGEVLIGATVFVKELGQGTITNNYGYFSITIPPGKYNVSLSYIGYEVSSRLVDFSSNMKFNFNLDASLEWMDEVVIIADEEEIIFKKVSSQSEMVPEQIKMQPALMGESDVLKSLEFQPGINYYGDGSSNFHVRGGHYDQNLILLDEATLYNPSHLLGLFTPIIPDAVNNITIYKSGFPVNYGGRLSSVIDIRTKDGNKEKISGSGSLGLISARASLEGPIRKGKSSYVVSLRRSYFDNFIKLAAPNFGNLYFYDFTIKLNLRLGKKDRLFFTQYKGQDVFKLYGEQDNWTGIDWGNVSTTLRWNHVFGSRMFLNTSLYTSNYDYYLRSEVGQNAYWNSRIINTALKEELTYFVTPNLTWRFGAKFGFYDFNPGNYYADNVPDSYQVSPVNSSEVVLYAGAEQQFLSRLILNYGLRFTSWANFGEGFVVDYNSNYEAQGVEYYDAGESYYKNSDLQPRLALSLKTGAQSYLKASYSRTVQHINQISNSTSPFNSFEVWLPSGLNIKPQTANIIDVSFMKLYPDKGLSHQASIFGKRMDNQIGYTYHANMLVNPLIEGELRQGDGRAYGMEYSLQINRERLSSQIAYTYSRSFLQIDELNGGREFPATHDRPHSFNATCSYQAKPRWQLTGTLTISSGSCISTPTSFYNYKGYQVPIFTEQNNDRLPTYRRFDIASTHTLNKRLRKYKHQLTFAVYNFFARKNPIFLYFNKTLSNDGSLQIPSDRLNPAEITPSIRYVFVFIPSVTYQFKF